MAQITVPDWIVKAGGYAGKAKVPIAVVATASITLLVHQWFFAPPAPAPGPAGPDLGLAKRCGTELAAYVRKAYAEAMDLQASMLAEGKDVITAQDAKEDVFHDMRHRSFEKACRRAVEQVAPEGDDLSDPAKRKAMVAVLRAIGQGIMPDAERKKYPTPPPAPVPVPPGPPGPVDPAPGPQPTPTPPPQPTPGPNGGGTPQFPTGWLNRPAERAKLAQSLRTGRLKESAPDLFQADNDKDVYLYKAWKEVLGAYPPYPAQQIGDCTSFGSSHAIDLLQCIDIIVYKQKKDGFQEICTEATYAFGREVAGMLHDGGDGCFGVAVAGGLKKFGTVPRSLVGAYSGKRAKDWGYSGAPAEIKTEAVKHRLGEDSLVETLAEADAALNNGYPFIVCSMQGFTMARDSTGLCQPQGTWAHCMFCAGRRKLNGRPQYLICQSWGPNVPKGPLWGDQPDFSFWVDGAVLQRMLAEKDSLAFSRFQGYAPRPLPDRWRYAGFGTAGDDSIKQTSRAQDRTPDVIPWEMSPRLTPYGILSPSPCDDVLQWLEPAEPAGGPTAFQPRPMPLIFRPRRADELMAHEHN